MFCTRCGKEYSNTRTSCPFCGAKSTNNQQQSQSVLKETSENKTRTFTQNTQNRTKVEQQLIQQPVKQQPPQQSVKEAVQHRPVQQSVQSEQQPARQYHLLNSSTIRQQAMAAEKYEKGYGRLIKINEDIEKQKKWFKFFNILPIIMAGLIFLSLFIYFFIYAIELGRINAVYYLYILLGAVLGAIGAAIEYFILKCILSFFILNIYYKEKYFIEKEMEKMKKNQ